MSVDFLCSGKMQNGRIDLLKGLKMSSELGFEIHQNLGKAIKSSLGGVTEM